MLAAAAAWTDAAAAAPAAFLAGLIIGFVASGRYRLVKRNGEDCTK